MKTNKIIIWIMGIILLSSLANATTNDALFWIDFNDDFTDVSNYGRTITIVDAPTRILNGKLNNGSKYDDNDLLQAGDMNGTTLTAGGWINTTAGTENQIVMGVTTVVASDSSFYINYNTDEKFFARTYNGGSVGYDCESAGTYTDSQYHLFILRVEGTRVEGFVDGVVVCNSTQGTTMNEVTSVVEIGNMAQNPSVFNCDYGLDEVFYYNRSLDLSEMAELYNGGAGVNPYIIINFTITATDSFNSTSINVFNATVNGVFYNTSTGTIITNLTDGRNTNITVNAPNYFIKPYINYNTSSNLIANLTYYKTLFFLKEKIRTSPENTTINNFSLSFYNMNTSSIETVINSTTGNITAILTWNNTYNITVNAPGYELANFIYTSNQSINYPNFVFLYTTNSILIYIKDENTNQNLTGNISIRFTSNTSEWTNYTTTASFYIDNLPSGIWQLLISVNNTDYSSRKYTLTVYNRSHQTLTAYLSTNTSITTFVISDKDSGEYMEGVLTTMYKLINGSWEAVESKFTDITGSVQLNYNPISQYKFFLAKSGYDNYIFYLSPVLYSEYNIFMDRSTLYNLSQDLDKIAVIYSPSIFTVGTNTFKWIIQSPYGELINYGYTLTYPGGSNITSGSNAIGEQLEIGFNITNANIWDQVVLNYYYTTSLAGTRNFTSNFPITNPSLGNNTIAQNRNNTYGLGLFERIFIATLVVIFVVGIATLVGQTTPGIALGVFVMGYLVYNGFIPIWSVLISMIISIWLLSMEAQ